MHEAFGFRTMDENDTPSPLAGEGWGEGVPTSNLQFPISIFEGGFYSMRIYRTLVVLALGVPVVRVPSGATAGPVNIDELTFFSNMITYCSGGN